MANKNESPVRNLITVGDPHGHQRHLQGPVQPLEDDDYDYDARYQKEMDSIPGRKGDEFDQVPPKSLTNLTGIMIKDRLRGAKVQTPAFLTMKRSILEVYSDMISPALLEKVCLASTPFERMCRVIYFYFGAMVGMHGHQISSKKPYSPSEGELFRCVWPVWPDGKKSGSGPFRTGTDGVPVYETNGMIATSGTEHYSFLAEQVGKTPSEAAFHLKCLARNLTLTGNFRVETETQFGIPMIKSLTVRRIGLMALHLRDHGEDYFMDLPDIKVTDPQSTPTPNFVGGNTICCPQTGLTCRIQFVDPEETKDKKSRCEVVALVEQKVSSLKVRGDSVKGQSHLLRSHPLVHEPRSSMISLVKLQGKWNNRISVTGGALDTSLVHGQVFFDAASILQQIPPERCFVPIAHMEWFESRRLWRRLFRNLCDGNLDQADAEKTSVKKFMKDHPLKHKHFRKRPLGRSLPSKWKQLQHTYEFIEH